MTYLFFADDSFFYRANQQDCNTILDILHLCETTSGQQINRDETQLFFNSNIDQAMKDHIKASLGVSATNHIESYLGVPSFVGRAKNRASVILRRGFGKRYKVRRRNYFHKGVRKF